MAKLYAPKSHLQRKRDAYFCAGLLGALCCVGGLGLSLAFFWSKGWLSWGALGGSLVLLGTGVLVAKRCWRQTAILHSGVQGEARALKTLRSLPSDTYVVANVGVPCGKFVSELDAVVISPYGVWVVEVKNHNGTLTGSAGDDTWTQHKTGRGGGRYSKSMPNPMRQVRTHVQRLEAYLRQQGLACTVRGVVYFANTAAVLSLTLPPKCDVALLCAANDSLVHAFASRGNPTLPTKTQAKLYALLKQRSNAFTAK